jgi:hypothetical protein
LVTDTAGISLNAAGPGSIVIRDTIYIAWQDTRNGGQNDIYFSKSADGGQTFNKPNINLIDAVGSSYFQGYPTLCCDDSGGVYCAWTDLRDDYNHAKKIFMNYSKSYGDSFRLNNLHVDDRPWDDSGVCEYVTMSANEHGKLFTAWEDTRNGGYDIYTNAGSYSGIVGQPEPKVYVKTSRLAVSPNPFRVCANIKYDLSNRTNISLKIYNVAGGLVRTLEEGGKNPGGHTVIWNGRNDQSNSVAAGIYLVRLHTSEVNQQQKIILIK